MPSTDIDREIDDLTYQVEKSLRYHHRMRGWYDLANRAILFVIIAVGAGPIIDPPDPFHPALFAVGASMVAALNLVWQPSHRARDHHLLHGRFSDLLIEVRKQKANVVKEERLDVLGDWQGRRIVIEKDEPPIFYALEADCDNEMRRALDRTSKMVHISLWHRVTKYILRHNPNQFVTS